jgi:hydroxymethylbilane synthase
LQFETEMFTTTGDRTLDAPFPEIGGKGLFTAELENALLRGEIDVAVHSLKDLPIDNAPGLVLGAICERADARDVVISRKREKLATLRAGARIGTSSLRRAAQLLAYRPDLDIAAIRGNIDTRVEKAMTGGYDAIILAAAGIGRLELEAHISEFISFDVMLPAPGQGALAVQCRADDTRTLGLLRALDHAPTRAAVTAERAFLARLGGGCSSPVAAYAEWLEGGSLHLDGLVASLDGTNVIRVSSSGRDPLEVGARAAADALERGAAELVQ